MEQKQSLYAKLIEYGQSDFYPYHMPGHKRCTNVQGNVDDPLEHIRSIDITEIEGFDNLHHAEGILKDAQEYAAKVYGAIASFFLVGGSTSGILTAVSALLPRGGRILIARNCHKSVYHGIFLRGLKVSYLEPEYEENFGVPLPITAQAVRKTLEKEPDIQAVLITSPTYEGLVADVAGIADVVHEAGIPLIVDEAHGAHFGFADGLPESSVAHADVVVQSTHKTTRALTQTALLHVCSSQVNTEEIQRYLDIYMTSSPSYVLMASIEEALQELAENGRKMYAAYLVQYKAFLEEMAKLKYFQVMKVPGMAADPCKLVIGSRKVFISGQSLYDILLEKYHLQMELCQGRHVLAIMTPYDRPEGFKRLLHAFQELDKGVEEGMLPQEQTENTGIVPKFLPEQKLCPEEAWKRGEKRPLLDCVGRICCEFVYQYPPGTPIMVPGEVWDEEQISYVIKLFGLGYEVLGIESKNNTLFCDVLE